jgi:acyl-CoA thioester hydrolase
MYTHSFEIRVRYSETDKMGYVYYGNYTHYYEVGRVEALRSLGITYRELEDDYKIFLPVTNIQVRYLRPAYYDNLLRLETSIINLPTSKIDFTTVIYNEKNELINQGQVQLCFIDGTTMKKMEAPDFIIKKLIHYFGEAKE